MVVEKKYQIAYTKNAKGEITECLECKVVGASEYKAIKKDYATRKALLEQDEELVAKQELEKERIESVKRYIHNIFLAKAILDNKVDLGTEETNDDFEKAFDNFVNGAELDMSNAPLYFRKVLERLG